MSANNEDLLVLTPSELLGKIVKDLYFGNGKPALTLRISAIEDQQAMFKEAIDDQKAWQSTATKILIGTLLSSIGGLIVIAIDLLTRH